MGDEDGRVEGNRLLRGIVGNFWLRCVGTGINLFLIKLWGVKAESKGNNVLRFYLRIFKN